jgi:hypothetical protein
MWPTITRVWLSSEGHHNQEKVIKHDKNIAIQNANKWEKAILSHTSFLIHSDRRKGKFARQAFSISFR